MDDADEILPSGSSKWETANDDVNLDGSSASARFVHTPAKRDDNSNCLRPDGSISAVKDGRNLLATFRQNKRRNRSSSPASTGARVPAPARHGAGSGDPSRAGKRPSQNRAVDYLEMYQSRAPSLARNLEAVLDASLANRRNATPGADDDDYHGPNGTTVSNGAGGAGSHRGGMNGGAGDSIDKSNNDHINGGKSKNKDSEEIREEVREEIHNCGPNEDAHAVESHDKVPGEGNCDESSKGSFGVSSVSITTAAVTSAATTAAAACIPVADVVAAATTTPSPPRNNTAGIWEGSREGPTPEMLRQDARISQADFLSSVLPAQDSDFAAGPGKSLSTTTSPYLQQQSSPPTALQAPGTSTSVTSGEPPNCTGRATVDPAAKSTAALSSVDTQGPSVSDHQAADRWTSMRRLQDQSTGLGSASDHQLTRALQICRDLRGLKTGAGRGFVSGNEHAPLLDALQSTLHGLEEVLSKRALIDKAAGVEAEALGGPAVLSNLLCGNGHRTQADAAKATSIPDVVADGGAGWLTGSQLKAFEEQVQTRYSMEISALTSERRKLRNKVEMFQRQIQLLKREGASHSPATAVVEGGTAGSVFDPATREKQFSELLDARLGEERRVQAALEAELSSLHRSLEEKDGLISALREALRSAATPEANGDAPGTTAVTGLANQPHDGSEEPTAPPSHNGTAGVLRGRGVFAPRSNDSSRSRGRYHSRSSRLLGAQGPVAEAKAVEAKAAAAAATAPIEGRARAGGERRPHDRGGRLHGEELRGAESAKAAGASRRGENGSSSSSVAALARHSSSSAGSVVVEPDAVFAPTNNSGSGAVASSGLASVNGVAGEEERGYGDGRLDVIAQATTSALRVLWDSAWVGWSRAGLDGRDGGVASSKITSKPRGNSSHAVLIL